MSNTLINLLNSVGAVFSLSTSNLLVLHFRLAKATFLANFDIQITFAFRMSHYAA